LAKLLRSVVAHPEVSSNWVSIFNWSGAVLVAPKRGGKRHNLTATIKKRIADFSSDTNEILQDSSAKRVGGRSVSASEQLAHAVSAKLEDGNIAAAIRILCSEESPAVPSMNSFRNLQTKHPPGSLDNASLPVPGHTGHLAVLESDVKKAILSFPSGSAGGPDGLRPQHLKDLLLCRESGSDFLSDLTLFVNSALEGRCPEDISPIFFGGRLIGLNKKDGGIRPIAIGFSLRRLVSKCANCYAIARIVPELGPRQLGVGVAGGCEAAVHAARRYLESMPEDHVLVKLDFSNAFNCLHRRDMLLSVQQHLPDIYAFCYAAYAHPTQLFHGQYLIMSEEGPQQGDPLGPLLFSMTIQPLLASLASVLTLGYLDDLTVGDKQSIVVADVQRVKDIGENMGLTLNVSKCELFCHPNASITDPLLLSFSRRGINDASLLGAPLFIGSELDDAWSNRLTDLRRAVERLSLLGAQDALILLRASFSAPRVQHLMRCSPSVDHSALSEFDNILRSAICKITNCDLSDNQWLQAGLPIRDGGLGIRRVSSLALPAFLASAAGSLPLQDAILSQVDLKPDSFFAQYLPRWSAAVDSPPPDLPLSGKQSFWDRPGVLSDKAKVGSNLLNEHGKASFLAATASHSGDWLLALPITACGLRLEDEAVRTAVALRLGVDLCVPHVCHCVAQVDAFGVHSFVCKHASGRINRHQAINDVIARAFASADIPVTKEPNGLSIADNKRPDGLTLLPWREGKPLAWDVTVICPLAQSYISGYSIPGAAAELAATRKLDKYSNLPNSYLFQPIAFENLGAINESAISLISDLGHKISMKSNDPRESIFLFQRLSVTLQRFNSILLRESFVAEDPNK
jgi:hypothetical protein